MNSDKTPTLLVVDDEKDLRDLISQGMQIVGAKVILACDGIEGWEVYKETNPDLVITDIAMPKRNGIELLNMIKDDNPDIPVLVLSGYLRKLSLDDMCVVMPEKTIEKPFSLGDLIKTVKEYLPEGKEFKEFSF